MIENSEKCPKCGHDLTALQNVNDPRQLAAEIMPHLLRLNEQYQLSVSGSPLAGSGCGHVVKQCDSFLRKFSRFFGDFKKKFIQFCVRKLTGNESGKGN